MHWLVDDETPLSESKEVHGGAVTCLSWHPVGHLLCSVGVDASVKFWTRARPGDALLGHLTTATLGPDQQVQTAAQAAAGVPATAEQSALAIPGLARPTAVAPPVPPPRPPSGPPLMAQTAVKSEGGGPGSAPGAAPQPPWAAPLTFERPRADGGGGGLPPPPGPGRGRMGAQARGRSGRFGRGSSGLGPGPMPPSGDSNLGGHFDRSRDGPPVGAPTDAKPSRREGGFGWAPPPPFGGHEAHGGPGQQHPGYGAPDPGISDYGGRGFDGGRCAQRCVLLGYRRLHTSACHMLGTAVTLRNVRSVCTDVVRCAGAVEEGGVVEAADEMPGHSGAAVTFCRFSPSISRASFTLACERTP